MKVGFVGLGIMGRNMARHIAAKGFDLSVWNRSKSVLSDFAKDGINIAEDLTEIASTSELLVSCVTNESALKEVYLGEQGILSTLNPNSQLKYIIDCSTVDPQFVRDLNVIMPKIFFFDAPVTGGEVGAINGSLVSMVGGDEFEFENVKPVIDAYSKAIYHMGKVGSGQEAKCVNQIAIALGISAVTESLFFCQEKGLPQEKMLQILQGGSASSWAFNTFGEKILNSDFKPGFFAKDMLKDLRITLKEAEKSMTPLPMTSLVKELYTGLINKKGTELGNHGLIEFYREMVENNK